MSARGMRRGPRTCAALTVLSAAVLGLPVQAQARLDAPRHGPGLGQVVRQPPHGAFPAPWQGVEYRHFEGAWYRPGPRGWVVVSPPVGVWVQGLPPWAVTVVIGGVAYWAVDAVYYRARDGGYEVVPAPVAGTAPATGSAPRQFVYPRQGQTASQQASDEYECHRWAVGQSEFDPSALAGTLTPEAAASSVRPEAARRDDYLRARAACLEGRGYTIR